jgi:hypothetical protein
VRQRRVRVTEDVVHFVVVDARERQLLVQPRRTPRLVPGEGAEVAGKVGVHVAILAWWCR